MVSLFVRLTILFTVIVAIAYSAFYLLVTNNVVGLTVPFIVLMIVATMIPITINLWYWLVRRSATKS